MLRVDLICPACGKETAGVGLHRDGEGPAWMTLCGCKVASTPGADLGGIRCGVFKLRDEDDADDHDYDAEAPLMSTAGPPGSGVAIVPAMPRTPDRDAELLRRSADAIRAQGDVDSADAIDAAADDNDEAQASRGGRASPHTVMRRAREAAARDAANDDDDEVPPPPRG